MLRGGAGGIRDGLLYYCSGRVYQIHEKGNAPFQGCVGDVLLRQVEGIANLGLSLLFVQIFPEEYRAAGVIAATIITSLLICHAVDPYVVYKHVFRRPVMEYWIRNYGYIGLFAAALVLQSFLKTENLLLNGLMAVGVAAVVLGMVEVGDRAFVRKAWGGKNN